LFINTLINFFKFDLVNYTFIVIKILGFSEMLSIITPIFFIENFILQFFILYVLYLLITNNNLYYILLYVFIEIVLLGLFICFYQLELFTGFLWVAEFTIIFIAVILLFYLNIDGLHLKYNININSILYYIPSILILLVFFNFDLNSELELFTPLELNYIDFFDNYYEAFNNKILNDFTALTISYYIINSIEFISVGILLLIGSVACVNLYKSNKNYSIVKQSTVLNTFDFFKDFINFTFIRKQDLNKQTAQTSTIRSIKKSN
jgi:hypothetical protein